ncbi:MAG TPA: hypothetical protein VI636_09025 [Candidatus Angelobacter sp.]
MTPQSHVMVVAPLKPEREAELRNLLASMNYDKGQVNPANLLVPFEQFGQIHFARLVILEDRTLEDIHTAYGLPLVDYPLTLAFIADFDGIADDFRADLARHAADGLQRIFSCCQDFDPGTDLARWMKEHESPAATMYMNWRGRTVTQIREENALRQLLEAYLQSNSASFTGKAPQEIHAALREFVREEEYRGRIKLTDPAPTPFGWWLRNFLHLIGVPLILLLLTPFLILYLPFFIYQLRRREKTDMVIDPRVSLEIEQELGSLEDHDVTNQFTVMGAIKPGFFRRSTMTFLLWVLEYTTRHIYIRGHLARISTIHAARWVFINQKRRMVFASNYDGSLDSYMDDFINKVGWGLNLVFSNGVSYPRTNWLVLDGSKNEQPYKYVLRRHQLLTEVWYKAYPGLTVFDLKRNTLIRQGIEKSSMSDADARQWVALF